MEHKLGVVVADIWRMMTFELMLPFYCWFGVVFLQILKAVVYQMAMLSFVPTPADHFGLFEVLYVSSIHLRIHCGAPLFVGLQVNQPYFVIRSVWEHNLLRTDHLYSDLPITFSFHSLPEQYLSVAVSVKKKYITLSILLNVLLSSLLLRQKHECVFEGSERISDIWVLFSEVNGNRLLLKHQIQPINS